MPKWLVGWRCLTEAAGHRGPTVAPWVFAWIQSIYSQRATDVLKKYQKLKPKSIVK